MEYSEVCEALSGPIPTLRTPYNREGCVDYQSLARMIDFDLEAGARAIVLTAGDSHYEAMSDREIGEITRFVARHVGDRAFLVAADRKFDTKQSVNFARECAEWGVDTLMVQPPNWVCSPTPESLASHYAEIGKHIPVMMVTNIFRPHGFDFGLETIKATLNTTDRVVAVKDDMGGSFARHMTALVHERWAVWSGGRKENHMNMAPYGAHGYLSSFLTFAPDVAHKYWNAWMEDRYDDAIEVITDIDMPFFDFITSDFSSFDLAFHAIYEIYGLANRWRPKPYATATDEEIELIRDWLKKKNLL